MKIKGGQPLMARRKPIPRTGQATFACPACGGVTRALETRRPAGRRAVLRQRKCTDCGLITRTREQRA
jgi:predicted RNA-binding Zn-ribbon protein involved in translation (DUF1610 family)